MVSSVRDIQPHQQSDLKHYIINLQESFLFWDYVLFEIELEGSRRIHMLPQQYDFHVSSVSMATMKHPHLQKKHRLHLHASF